MTGSFRAAILEQPANLVAGAQTARAALQDADLTPWRTGTVVVAAIGASHHAAIGFVHALRASGRRALLLSPAQLGDRGAGDAYVLVSQSGRSAETLAAAAAVAGAPLLAVTATNATPLAGSADVVIALGPAPDTLVATLSYTATLQALGLLLRALAGDGPGGWASIPELAAEVLAGAEDRTGDLAAGLAGATAFDCTGPGASEGSAREAALLIREGVRVPATAMETREYLHGPMESVSETTGAIVFGDAREARLATDLRTFGATVVTVAPDAGELAIVATDAPLGRQLLEILPVQLLVDSLAAIADVPIGELRRSQADTKVEV